MQDMNNAEEVLEFLLASISLGTYDRRFLANLQMVNVLSRKPITSNQAKLFTKILLKYQRQIAKFDLSTIDLSVLPWSLNIIESSEEFTKANIKVVNGQLILRTPYNSSFVTDYRNAQPLLKWDKEEKLYSGSFGLDVLKNTLALVQKHYSEIAMCDQIHEVINEVEKFAECKYWNPTLVKRNERLYIIACTQELADAISHLTLSTDLATLARLSIYGISVDSALVKEIQENYTDQELVTFACNGTVSIEQDQLESLKNYLVAIKCDIVFVDSNFTTRSTSKITEQLKEMLFDSSIAVWCQSELKSTNINVLSDPVEMPIQIKFGKSLFKSMPAHQGAKVISIVNSTPINLEKHERM